MATVTEYMVNGSLRNALQKNVRYHIYTFLIAILTLQIYVWKNAINCYGLYFRNLDRRKRLLIAMDIAFGMEYLHGKNIVHFDLKSDNLLVNLVDPHSPICKVN